MTLTIAHVVELSRGGPTTVVLNLVRHQKAQGHNPVLIACRNLISRELAEETGTDLLYTSSRNPVRIGRVVREIAPLIDRAGADILHLHSAFPGLYGRLALPKLRGPKPAVVYCAHGWAFTQDIAEPKKRIYATMERFLARRTDAIINISRSEAEAARRYGVSCGNDHMIYNGTADTTTATVADLGLDQAKRNLAFFGRFDRQKGLDHLLASFSAARRSDLTLTLIGSKLRGDHPTIALPPGVAEIDWVHASQVDAHMRAFDAIVLPSRWEAFGLVAVEAMRNARPVLVSNRGALPELVIDGYNGLVFDMDDPNGLAQALDRVATLDLARMGDNARAVFNTIGDLSGHLEKVDRVYATALARKG
ncbi:MAG: glycosyltransferase family 4 protein [Defluviimonas sp.]|uniref:glycosyltransferase family 4 protein n=1 Tax=Albidovulum sp. TaxID=1872424 RepID=UPI002A337D3E|nr:glycosyltransferase family 4 protein [Defluviimonas sp.]